MALVVLLIIRNTKIKSLYLELKASNKNYLLYKEAHTELVHKHNELTKLAAKYKKNQRYDRRCPHCRTSLKKSFHGEFCYHDGCGKRLPKHIQ